MTQYQMVISKCSKPSPRSLHSNHTLSAQHDARKNNMTSLNWRLVLILFRFSFFLSLFASFRSEQPTTLHKKWTHKKDMDSRAFLVKRENPSMRWMRCSDEQKNGREKWILWAFSHFDCVALENCNDSRVHKLMINCRQDQKANESQRAKGCTECWIKGNRMI